MLGGREVRFRCPAHAPDTHSSARWNRDKAVWHCDSCGAGGGAVELARLLGVARPEPEPGPGRTGRTPEPGRTGRLPEPGRTGRLPGPGRIVAIYPYDAGRRVVRLEPKSFRPQHRVGDGDGGRWVTGRGDGDWPLYRQDTLPGDLAVTVHLTEGEKDADTLAGHGWCAVSPGASTNPWRTAWTAVLAGRPIVIHADHDAPGRKRAAEIAARLVGPAASVRVVAYADGPAGGDVSDYLATHPLAALIDRIAAREPIPFPVPPDAPDAPDGADGAVGDGTPVSTVSGVRCVSTVRRGSSDSPDSPDSTDSTDSTERPERPERPDDWPEVIPLEDAALPAFPMAALSPVVARYVAALSVASQTPPDLAAMVALGVLSAACGGKLTVAVEPDWAEPANLYLLTLLESGNRKSAVFADARRPLVRWERERARGDREALGRHETRQRLAQREYEQALKRAENGTSTDALLAEAARLDLDQLRPPRQTQVIYDDITIEKLGSVLAEQDGAVAILSAEGGFFTNLAGRYSGVPAFDVYLAAHAGDEIRTNRQGRPAEYVARPALTLCVAAQPALAGELGRIGGFAAKGGLARLLPSLPDSPLGRRAVAAPAVPEAQRQAWQELVRALLDLDRASETDADGQRLPHGLTLAGAAGDALTIFREELEPRLGPDGDLAGMTAWASKLPGAVVRIAALLHVAETILPGTASAPGSAIMMPITSDVMWRAITIGEYFIPHARRFFDLASQSDSAPVRRVLDAALALGPACSRRDLYRKVANRTLFRDVRGLDTPLRILEERGYLRVERQMTLAGQPGVLIRLNPALPADPV